MCAKEGGEDARVGFSEVKSLSERKTIVTSFHDYNHVPPQGPYRNIGSGDPSWTKVKSNLVKYRAYLIN